NYILKDSKCSFMVTTNEILDKNNDVQKDNIQYFMLDHDLYTNESVDNLLEYMSPDQGAYIIYTSGSTGNPKGVLNTHYNVTRLLDSSKQRFDFDSTDNWILFHSIAFDFSVWEMWGS